MKITLIFITLILSIIAIIFIYYGVFKKVNCCIAIQGGEILVFKDMVGDYAKSGKLSDEVYYNLIKDYKIETFKGFGIYYDNPKEVEKSQLRSEIGCIVEKNDELKVSQIRGELKTKKYPEKQYIIAEFPLKGKFSIILGVMKVYPAINNFITSQGYNSDGAVMEIYDVPNKKIVYRKEIVEK